MDAELDQRLRCGLWSAGMIPINDDSPPKEFEENCSY